MACGLAWARRGSGRNALTAATSPGVHEQALRPEQDIVGVGIGLVLQNLRLCLPEHIGEVRERTAVEDGQRLRDLVQRGPRAGVSGVVLIKGQSLSERIQDPAKRLVGRIVGVGLESQLDGDLKRLTQCSRLSDGRAGAVECGSSRAATRSSSADMASSGGTQLDHKGCRSPVDQRAHSWAARFRR